MTTLARALQSRNHDVVFISLPDGEPSIRAAGLTFVPCAEKEFPSTTTILASTRDLGRTVAAQPCVLVSDAPTLPNDRHGVAQKRDQFFPVV